VTLPVTPITHTFYTNDTFMTTVFSARHMHPLLRLSTLMACATLCVPTLAADEKAQMAMGKKLFSTAVPACALCHTLKDAGSAGEVGPVLDEMKPDAARVAKVLRDGLGSMPSFKASLSEAQIAALARYVSKASGGEK
jgi:cytochrome c6